MKLVASFLHVPQGIYISHWKFYDLSCMTFISLWLFIIHIWCQCVILHVILNRISVCISNVTVYFLTSESFYSTSAIHLNSFIGGHWPHTVWHWPRLNIFLHLNTLDIFFSQSNSLLRVIVHVFLISMCIR